VDRAKPGSKHHIIDEANGIPLTSSVTGADVPDIQELAPRFNALPVPAGAGKVGHPKTKPEAMMGARGYDSGPHRQGLRELGVEPLTAEKNPENGSGLGVVRWVVARMLGWIHQYRRLRIRHECRPNIHQAFLTPACIQEICASVLVDGYS
jgi:hypothetical protein